jgi:hypothetical protein
LSAHQLMIRKADLIAVVSDTRLSAESRIIVLYVANLGDGRHEIPYAEFHRLLNQAGEKRIRRAVQDAVDLHWVHRAEGGRSHPMRFTFTPAKAAGLNDAEDADSPAASAAVNTPVTYAEVAVLSDSPAKVAGLNGGRTREARYLLTDEQMEMVKKEPPIIPLSEHAEAALKQHARLLSGCRGALRDYLLQRVPTDQQYGYVQTLAGWVNGLEDVWHRPDGSNVPKKQRPKKLAAALNKLAASDERRMKRPLGDPDNLLLKLTFVLKRGVDEQRNGNHAAGAGGKERGETRRSAADEYAHLAG